MLATRHILRSPAVENVLLTRSGNEITDAVRSLSDQGDGLTSDSSTGIWPAATNRAINSNAKTNTTSIIDVGATTSRVASGLVGADTTHFSTVTDNAATAEGASQLISGGAAATQYTFSMWLSGTGTVKLYISDTVAGKQLGAQITLTATPTKYSVTATTGAASADWTVGFETDSQQGITVTHGRWMAETGAIATPHVLADGTTVARSAGRVQQRTAGLFTPAQGFLVLRLRNNWTGSSLGSSILALAQIPLTGSDEYLIFLRASTNNFEAKWTGAASRQVIGGAPAIGASSTLAVQWGNGVFKGSLNGAAFSTSTAFTSGTFATNPMEIGSADGSGGSWAVSSCDYFWALSGSGSLTNADIAYYHSLGNAGPPRFAGLPGRPTGLWDGVSGVFQRRRSDV